MRRDNIAVDAAHFGAISLQPLHEAHPALRHFRMLRLKGHAVLLGRLQLLLARGQLLIEEAQSLAHLALAVVQILVTEDLDHLLDDLLRQMGIFRIGAPGGSRSGGNLEQIVLIVHHLDRLGQPLHSRFHLLAGLHLGAQRRGADDLFKVHRAGQRIADAIDIVAPVALADAHLRGQRIVKLHKDARARFIGVGDHRHHHPADQADHPGYAQCQPAAVPDTLERCPEIVEDRVHVCISRSMLRTRSRG